ncbi:cation diffusion facilitator family transporter [Roseofilum casamattae]|uniref:Cation diffusion facilitator family transporter n=1 Tax=Roseofilum casamattae BLCC-M143 TaxID=3022442 RepID=A0ABT7BUW0_9CYAN|nr:cation diffusion facilitator family transporter [Roseofilum casamattae]MDJ1182885.1 cation diffusion facilitator family transporter [Roseofilum casamattae BLCC-M143]
MPADKVRDIRLQVRQVLLITLALNLVVLCIKTSIGWKTGALSLLADALHSLTDSANNILGLIANQLASPKPDREHPYGHQKFDAIGALGIAAFLGFACFEILSSAIGRLISGGNLLKISSVDLWILLLVLGINIFVAYYERWVGRQIGSGILIADAKHTMSDVWVTVLVIGGLIGVNLGYPWLDVVLAFPVALLVFQSGWEVLQENLPWLTDEIAIAPEAIHAIVMDVPGVINCHDIASRGIVGRQVFIEMHLIVDAVDVAASHQITEAVEERLENEYYPVRVLIHVEPPDYQSDRITFTH